LSGYVGRGLDLVENAALPEILCTSFARIELLAGGLVCIVCAREGVSPADCSPELQACGRIFLPLAAFADVIQLLTEALAGPKKPPSQRLS
jgi:hypothetical protein